MEGIMDTHIHTNYSDGEFDIRKVISMIINRNVRTFSITDHDCVDSCRFMDSFNLATMGENPYEYIRGVEISSKMGKYDMHILGYNFNYTENMNRLLSRIKELRREKVLRVIETVRVKYGVRIDQEDIHNLILKPGVIGKGNVITLLHANGCEGTNSEINQKYLRGIKTGICIDADIEDSVGVIKGANGIPILAHPRELEDRYNVDVSEIIKDLIDKGVDGIEVYNSLHSLEDIKRYLELAKKYNLLISGGSDYHGIYMKRGVEIGNVSRENLKIKNLSLVDKVHEIGIAA